MNNKDLSKLAFIPKSTRLFTMADSNSNSSESEYNQYGSIVNISNNFVELDINNNKLFADISNVKILGSEYTILVKYDKLIIEIPNGTKLYTAIPGSTPHDSYVVTTGISYGTVPKAIKYNVNNITYFEVIYIDSLYYVNAMDVETIPMIAKNGRLMYKYFAKYYNGSIASKGVYHSTIEYIENPYIKLSIGDTIEIAKIMPNGDCIIGAQTSSGYRTGKIKAASVSPLANDDNVLGSIELLKLYGKYETITFDSSIGNIEYSNMHRIYEDAISKNGIRIHIAMTPMSITFYKVFEFMWNGSIDDHWFLCFSRGDKNWYFVKPDQYNLILNNGMILTKPAYGENTGDNAGGDNTGGNTGGSTGGDNSGVNDGGDITAPEAPEIPEEPLYTDTEIVGEYKVIKNKIDPDETVTDLKNKYTADTESQKIIIGTPNINAIDEWDFLKKENDYDYKTEADKIVEEEIFPSDDLYKMLHDVEEYELHNSNQYKIDRDTRHTSKINRFHLIPSNQGSLSTKSFIFMTRPDLNLFKESNPRLLGNSENIIDNTQLSEDVDRIPIFRYIHGLTDGTKDVLKSLEFYCGENNILTPWLSIISNQARSYDVMNRDLDTVFTAETFHGNKVVYGEPTFKHLISGTVDIAFKDRRDLSLYFTLKAWVEYIHAVSLGYITPKRMHMLNYELDYATSLYYIVTDETMSKIIYWEKLTGVFPITVPDSIFSFDQTGRSEGRLEYNITFAYSMRSTMDDFHLSEINNLYSSFLPRIELGNSNIYDRVGSSINDLERFDPKATFPNSFKYSCDTDVNRSLARLTEAFGLSQTKEDIIKLIGGTYDESLSGNIQTKENLGIEKFYYGNNIPTLTSILPPTSSVSNTSITDLSNIDNYKIQGSSVNSDGITETQVIDAKFLPNYIPALHIHGVPYVTGPFITRNTEKMYSSEYGSVNISTGHYDLMWV